MFFQHDSAIFLGKVGAFGKSDFSIMMWFRVLPGAARSELLANRDVDGYKIGTVLIGLYLNGGNKPTAAFDNSHTGFHCTVMAIGCRFVMSMALYPWKCARTTQP